MKRLNLAFNCMFLVCIGTIFLISNPALAETENTLDNLTVDFGYSPPQWQTAICLPDDPYKSLVGKRGILLYHFRQIDGREFGTRISIQVAGNMITKLNGIATSFGKLHLTLKVDASGKTARLKVEKLSANPPEKIVVHLDQWASGETEKVLIFAGDTAIDTVIKIKQIP